MSKKVWTPHPCSPSRSRKAFHLQGKTFVPVVCVFYYKSFLKKLAYFQNKSIKLSPRNIFPNIIKDSYFLHGHAFVLQICESTDGPLVGQILSPPFTGLLQLLVRVILPVLQISEQPLQPPQGPQFPSTEIGWKVIIQI